MNQVRLGIIGLGNMGGAHAKQILANKINRCVLSAVCDTDPARLKTYPDLPQFPSHKKLFKSVTILIPLSSKT